MNTRTLLIALVLAAMTLVACTPGHGGQTGNASLEGTHWVLLTLDGRPPLAGTTITAEFLEDQITGHSGCNSYFGPYAVGGGALQFEEIGMTAMACLEPEGVMVQETAYIELLRNAAWYRLAGDRLEMLGKSSEVILVYERQDVPEADPADLVGTEWSLVMLDDSSLDEGMTITIRFEENQFRGLAVCRHFEGDYHANGGEIRFTSITMLEDECPGAGNEYYVQEGRFTDSLTWARHWGIVGGQLEIQTVRGGVLLFAQATPMPEATLEGTGWALTTLTETITLPAHATPVSQQPAAGICGNLEGDWVVVTIHPDIPDPRCARVAPHQKLRVVNRTSATLHVALGNLEATIEPEGEYAFGVPFGAYLAPGVHVVQVSPCCGPELWLEEPITTVPTQAATP